LICSNRATIESAGTGALAVDRAGLSQHEIAAALKVKQRCVHDTLLMRLREVTIARNSAKIPRGDEAMLSTIAVQPGWTPISVAACGRDARVRHQ
jgi:hypothetical protein